MKKYFKLGIIILTMTFLLACNKDQKESEDIFERGYIIMGIDDTFAPMGFRDKNGELVGFDIDLAKALSKEINLEIKLQPIDWTMKEVELESNNIDIIWNGYSITKARAKKVNFSDSYLKNKQIIISIKEDIIDKNDLKGKKVAIQNSSSSLEAVNKYENIKDSFFGNEPILFDTNNEAFLDLESGRSDIVIADEVLAKYYIKQRKNIEFKISNENFGQEEYAIGIRKLDDKLLEVINSGLKTLKENGEYEKIYEKWFLN